MSKVIEREQCPACASHGRDNSQDNLAVYDDGHKYCFACEYYESGKMKMEKPITNNLKFLNGSINAISERRINEKTARMYSYATLEKDGRKVDIASYYRDGAIVAQKLRGPNKAFQWRGESSNIPLYGQHLWANTKGKRIVITEGEIDCLTVSQLLENKWPVVSLPSGAAGAAKAIKDNLEFLNSY